MVKASECSRWFRTSYSYMPYTLSLLVHDQSFPKKKGWFVDFPWLSKVPEVDFWWDATMVRYSIWTWTGTERRKKLDPSREAMDLPTCHRLRRQGMGCTLWGVFATRCGCLGEDNVPSGTISWRGDPTPFFLTFVSPFYDSASVYYKVQTFFSSQIAREVSRCWLPLPQQLQTSQIDYLKVRSLPATMFWIESEASSNIFRPILWILGLHSSLFGFLFAHFLDVFFKHIALDSVYGSIG